MKSRGVFFRGFKMVLKVRGWAAVGKWAYCND